MTTYTPCETALLRIAGIQPEIQYITSQGNVRDRCCFGRIITTVTKAIGCVCIYEFFKYYFFNSDLAQTAATITRMVATLNNSSNAVFSSAQKKELHQKVVTAFNAIVQRANSKRTPEAQLTCALSMPEETPIENENRASSETRLEVQDNTLEQPSGPQQGTPSFVNQTPTSTTTITLPPLVIVQKTEEQKAEEQEAEEQVVEEQKAEEQIVEEQEEENGKLSSSEETTEAPRKELSKDNSPPKKAPAPELPVSETLPINLVDFTAEEDSKTSSHNDDSVEEGDIKESPTPTPAKEAPKTSIKTNTVRFQMNTPPIPPQSKPKVVHPENFPQKQKNPPQFSNKGTEENSDETVSSPNKPKISSGSKQAPRQPSILRTQQKNKTPSLNSNSQKPSTSRGQRQSQQPSEKTSSQAARDTTKPKEKKRQPPARKIIDSSDDE